MKRSDKGISMLKAEDHEEDQELQWREDKASSRRATKKCEDEAKKQAVAARKAQTRLLAKQEEEELDRVRKNKKDRESEAQRRWEEEWAVIQKQFEEAERRKLTRIASKKEYEKMVLVENKNHAVVEARSIQEALSKLNVEVVKVRAKEGNKGDCLFVYTQGEERPLLVDLRIIV